MLLLDFRHSHKRITDYLPLILFILVAYPIAVSRIVALESFVIGDIDLWPSVNTHIQLFLNSWYDTGSGGTGKVYSPFVLVRALFVAAFEQLAAGKFFLLFLIPSAMLSMFFASKVLIPSLTARYLAAFLYAVNPITLGEFYSASPLLAFYAIQPLVAYFFIKLLEAESLNMRSILLFSITAAAAILILVDSIILIPLLLGAIMVASYITKKHFVAVQIKNLAISVTLIPILILPVIVGYYQPASNLNTTIAERGISNPINDVIFTYSKADLLNLSKLAGNEGTGMSQLGYNDVTRWWNALGLVIPIVAFSFLAFGKIDSRKMYLVGAMSIIAISIIVFIWLTKEHLTFFIFEDIPLLYTFRNPRKLMFVLSFAVSLLFAVGAYQLIEKIKARRRKFLHFLCVSGLALILLAYNWPFLTGDLGISQSRTNFSSRYQIPERYFEIRDVLEAGPPSDSRVIWMPMDLLPQYIVTGLDVNPFLMPSGSGLKGNIPEYYLALYSTLIDHQTNHWGLWLAAADIEYVVVDKASNQLGNPSLTNKWDTIYPTGSPLEYVALLNKQDDLKLMVDNKEFAIFQNTEFHSKIAFYDIKALPFIQAGNIEAAHQYLLPSLDWEKKSATEYSIIGRSASDVIMVIFDNYDPLWSSTNSAIDHFKAFNWANGFVIPASDNIDFSVHYSFQTVYVVTSIIAYVTWGVVIIMVLRQHMKLKRVASKTSN